MKTIFAIILPFCAVTCMQAQVTYFGSNNYFLNLFTNTGFSSYDWRFEPLKTDLERGWLKGDVAKVVTTINDNASLRGSGTLFADTTYYNRQGNITKIVAPILDNFFFDGKNLRPDTWLYEYNANGKLKEYTKHTANQRHVHTMQQDGRGNIVREIYPDYVTWSWGYDTNGTLMSGATHTIGGEVTHNLKYQNGQLISMSPVGIEKPGTVTYTYAPNGRMASMKYFFVDGYDDEVWYIETTITLSYNDKGDIIQAVREEWNNTSKWVRKQQMGKSIYNITYTYDDKDNWTRAVMSRKSMYGGKTTENTPNAITVTRAITYRNASVTTSPTTNIVQTNDETYEVVDKNPSFPGGEKELYKFLASNMIYPKSSWDVGEQGRVFIQFVINTDGSISETRVWRSVSPALDAEALRVVQQMPRWIPGQKNGKNVRVRFTIPITFRLQ